MSKYILEDSYCHIDCLLIRRKRSHSTVCSLSSSAPVHSLMTLGLSSHISYQHLPSLCTNQQYLYKSSYNQLSKTPGCLMEQGNWANSFPHLQCQPAMKTILYYYYIPHGLLTIIKHQLIKHQWRYVPQRPSRSSHLQMCEDFVLNFYLKINWWIRWLNSGWVFFWEFFKGFNNIDSHNFKTNYTKHEHQNSYFSPNWWDPWGSDLGPHYAIISLWWASPTWALPLLHHQPTMKLVL